MTLRKSNWMTAACLAALSCTGAVEAQDDGSTGIVRISDRRPGTPVKPASFHGHQGGYVNNYNNGGCPTGDCQYGNGNACQHGPCFHGFFQERYCKNSPDHGYSPPAKYPLQRRGVQYNQYFPNQWYGAPGASYQGAPVVYQPTDTTQLGFHYQHVPFWQPNPSVMPQRPVPAQWHITAPVAYASGFHQGDGGYGYGGYSAGAGSSNCDFQTTTPTPAAPAAPTPVNKDIPAEINAAPEASLPPAPRQFENAAASGHIRRAIY
jgi:hypothetical protein